MPKMPSGTSFPVGPEGALLSVGAKGWLFWNLNNEVDVRVQVAEFDGTFRPRTVSVTSKGNRPVTGEELRAVPLRRLAEAVTINTVADIIRDSWSRRSSADFSPSTTTEEANSIAVSFDVREPTPRLDAGMPTPLDAPTPTGGSKARKDDAFYLGIEARYRTLKATSPRPAVELAQQYEVKVSTVHRWLREAKYRKAILAQDLMDTVLKD